LKGLVDWGEESFYAGHSKSHMAELAHNLPVAFLLDLLLLLFLYLANDIIGPGFRDGYRFVLSLKTMPRISF
jgi:hypothetical protein